MVLLHCYPYHRQAAYLANVFPQVVLDVSLAVNHVGPRASAVLAETLELAPFGSLLYASDGFGLAELHHLGAVLFREALGRVLEEWLADDVLTADDARRFARMIAGGNARRVYRLGRPEAARRQRSGRAWSLATGAHRGALGASPSGGHRVAPSSRETDRAAVRSESIVDCASGHSPLATTRPSAPTGPPSRSLRVAATPHSPSTASSTS